MFRSHDGGIEGGRLQVSRAGLQCLAQCRAVRYRAGRRRSSTTRTWLGTVQRGTLRSRGFEIEGIDDSDQRPQPAGVLHIRRHGDPRRLDENGLSADRQHARPARRASVLDLGLITLERRRVSWARFWLGRPLHGHELRQRPQHIRERRSRHRGCRRALRSRRSRRRSSRVRACSSTSAMSSTSWSTPARTTTATRTRGAPFSEACATVGEAKTVAHGIHCRRRPHVTKVSTQSVGLNSARAEGLYQPPREMRGKPLPINAN